MSSSEIDRRASEWIVRLDKDAPESVRADFEAWYAADARHQAAYLRQLEAWNRLDRLQALRPPRIERSGERESGQRRWPSGRRRRLVRSWLLAGVAAAVAVMVVGGYVLRDSVFDVGERREYATSIGGFERVVLSDGSVLELNTDSKLRIDLDRQRRVIHLERGEATFRVAHDAQRPFMVMVGGTVVRAIGTQFNVRRRDSSVEVMVVEGVVARGSMDTLGQRSSIPQPTTPVVSAGKLAIAEPTGLKLHEVAHEEVQRTLAWQSGMLSFNGQTLVEAADEFNRYNRRKVVVADPALASLRIGGQFLATNIDTFAAVLEQKFGIQVAEETGQIVLRAAPAATPLTEEYRKVTQ
jgi:transmembrane sensor